MPRSLVGFFKYVWEGGRSVFLPILRILLIFDVLSFCQLGTNNTAELSAFGEERPAAIEMFCDVSWHCDTNTVYINISYIMYTYIYVYIYILVSGMVPMPSYVLNFMQQIWGATLVKTCIHIYIYIMKSTFSWMILNDPQRQRLNLCFQRFIVRPCYGCVMKHPLTQGEQRWCTMTRSMPRRLLLANCDVRKVGRVKLCVCNLPRVLTLQSYCHEHSHQLTL